MKIKHSKFFLLSLTLILSLNVAQAQSLGSFFNRIKQKINETQKNILERNVTFEKTTDNSLVVINDTIAFDVRKVMIIIRKDNFSEQLVFNVDNGLFQKRLSLKNGAGIYDIEVYTHITNENDRNFEFHKRFLVENTDTRDMSYLLPSHKVQLDDVRIKNLVAKVTKNARNDNEAFMAIYGYITSTIKYDYASARDNSYHFKDYSAVNTLLNLQATCEGYTNLLAAMARAYGIRTKVIHGVGIINWESSIHAWNEVFINNEWKVVDPTWDTFNKKNYKKKPFLFMDYKTFSQSHMNGKVMDY